MSRATAPWTVVSLSASARGLAAKNSLARLAEGSQNSAPSPWERTFIGCRCWRLLAVFVFAQERAKTRVVANRVQIVVFAHVAEIAVAQFDGAAQGFDGLIGAFEQGVAAGQVVVGQRIIGPELDQALVDLEAVGIAALE